MVVSIPDLILVAIIGLTFIFTDSVGSRINVLRVTVHRGMRFKIQLNLFGFASRHSHFGALLKDTFFKTNHKNLGVL